MLPTSLCRWCIVADCGLKTAMPSMNRLPIIEMSREIEEMKASVCLNQAHEKVALEVGLDDSSERIYRQRFPKLRFD